MKTTVYPFPMRLVHWVTVCLVLAAVVLALLREEVEGKPLKRWLLLNHQNMGLLVLLLLLLRLGLHLKYRSQTPTHPLPWLFRLLAKATHALLMVMLVITPVLGWAYVSAKGHAPEFLGIWPLPALVDEDMDLADALSDWHVWVAYGFMGVIAAHALAACWHHWVKKDGVLSSMLLTRRSKHLPKF